MSFFKIPKIQQVSLDEFDRNRFDQPVARVDRCQTCHLAINRAGFEKEANPFKPTRGAKCCSPIAPIHRTVSVAPAVMKARK